MKYSIQLYSLRDVAEKDLEAGLKAVSEMGYEKVEFAGFGDKTAEEAAELLKKYNLEVSASHLSLNEVKPDAIEQTIANRDLQSHVIRHQGAIGYINAAELELEELSEDEANQLEGSEKSDSALEEAMAAAVEAVQEILKNNQ